MDKKLRYLICVLFFTIVLKINAQDPNSNDFGLDSILSKVANLRDSIKIDSIQKIAWKNRYDNPRLALSLLYHTEKLLYNKEYTRLYSSNLNFIGVIFLHLNDFSTALDYFFQALKFAEENEISEEIGYAFTNIAHVMRYKGENEKGIEYIRKAILINKKNHFDKALAYSYLRLSELYLNIPDYDSALFYANLSYKIRKQIKDSITIVNSIISIGEALEFKGDYRNALLKYLSVKNNAPSQERIYLYLARTYMKLNNYQSALDYGLQSYDLSMKKKDYMLAFDASVILSTAYLKIGQYLKSNAAIVHALELKDKIVDEQKNLTIFQLEFAYKANERKKALDKLQSESERSRMILSASILVIILLVIIVVLILKNRRKQIDDNILLTKQKIAIEEQSNKLSELNNTKDRFFSIIAHDLKNPLGAFQELTDLIYNNYDAFNDKERLDFLKTLKTSSENIYKLMLNLLEWSKSQRNKLIFEPNIVNVIFVIEYTINNVQLNASQKGISIEYDIPDPSYFYMDTNLFATILRNILSNSIKFTKNGGKISITCSETDLEQVISISDNGIGIPSDKLDKLFKIEETISTPGTNNEPGTGLGLILCKEFMEKHGGRIEVESEVGVGTTFNLIFPKNDSKR